MDRLSYHVTVDRPNILLIVLDAVRKDHLQPYGYSKQITPTINSLCDNSIRYEQAISPAPWTPPSHASMFTGKYPSNHNVFGRQPYLSRDNTTIASELSNLGYSTFGFSNSYHTSKERGFDNGFDYYHDLQALPRLFGKMFEPCLDYVRFITEYIYSDIDIYKYQHYRLLSALRSANKPFFAFINYNSAHVPYDPPKKHSKNLKNINNKNSQAVENISLEGGYEYMMGEYEVTNDEWDYIESLYDGEISYIDDLLDHLFSYLKKNDLFDETAIIVTSDHGEAFGERGLCNHQFSLIEPLINVPLIVKYPQMNKEIASDELVSLVDIAPTIIKLAGGNVPEEMNGRDLRSGEEPEMVFAEYGKPLQKLLERLIDGMFTNYDPPYDDIVKKLDNYRDLISQYEQGRQAIHTGEYKLIKTQSGETTLFEIDGLDEFEVKKENLKNNLIEQMDNHLDELPSDPQNEVLEDHVREHLKNMGYR